VSDLPRMGDWSPENTGGHWVGAVTGPAVGATFRGTNGHGRRRWSTDVRVTRCEPGRAFDFEVTVKGFSVARWSYSIESSQSGCVVTETWTDQRGRLAKLLGSGISGVSDRESHNRAGMETTLANLATALEA
jgi:hypothetical protein